MNVMETHSDVERVDVLAVCGISRSNPRLSLLKNQILCRVRHFVFLAPSDSSTELYSQERIAKKRAPMTSVLMARVNSSFWSV